jgi:hypothetical protein
MPGWTEKMLQLENLEATTRLRLAPGFTGFEDLSVTGGEYRVSGEYDDVRGVGRGVFLVEKDKLAVAVQVQPEKHSLRPLGAREWYQAAAEEQKRERQTSGRNP